MSPLQPIRTDLPLALTSPMPMMSANSPHTTAYSPMSAKQEVRLEPRYAARTMAKTIVVMPASSKGHG
jgi:hypothetical protein